MTLALQVELLRGCYVAAQFGDRDRVEWPPHPARLYSALVAVWAHDDPPEAHERAVLAWLAEQGAPEITCSEHYERLTVTHYVPVNDAAVVRDHGRAYAAIVAAEQSLGEAVGNERAERRAGKALERALTKAAVDSARLSARGSVTPGTIKSALALLPERRIRQGRTYPTALPHDAHVCFTWPAATPSEGQRQCLDALVARLHRLGHSSSLVSCRVLDDEPPAATWTPHPEGTSVLRTPAPGLLGRLEAEHARHQGREPRSLPAALVRYRQTGTPERREPPRPSLGQDWIVLARVEGRPVPLHRGLNLTRVLRRALLHHADEPIAEILSGHAPGAAGQLTSPTNRPHLAIVPLPFVGRRHADGAILGVALVLPRTYDPEERQAVVRAVGRWREGGAELTLGRAGIARFTVVDELDPRTTLRPQTWCRTSTQWATVTPIALDRTPRYLFRGTPEQQAAAWDAAADTIAVACEHVGLPLPAAVAAGLDGPLVGVPHQRAFEHYRAAGGRVQRLSVHARLTFPEPVHGPVLIGAGRYLGYGLCRPIFDKGSA